MTLLFYSVPCFLCLAGFFASPCSVIYDICPEYSSFSLVFFFDRPFYRSDVRTKKIVFFFFIRLLLVKKNGLGWFIDAEAATRGCFCLSVASSNTVCSMSFARMSSRGVGITRGGDNSVHKSSECKRF